MMHDLKLHATLLKDHLLGLPAKDRAFAQSLVDQFEKKGQLSEKQAMWLCKLADAAQGIPDFTKPEPDKVEVGPLSGLKAMFDKAAQKLKNPAIQLQMSSGAALRLSRAGETSKNPGAVYVKADGPNYVGKVMPSGEYVQAGKGQPEFYAEIADLLKQMSRHPAETAKAYGKLVGRCCFCNLPLSDPKSVAAGFGKQCAANYGLKWSAD